MRRAIRVIQAAGAVVVRAGSEVLLVHRPKYDDWSFPKGKLERDEPAPVAAVREVGEETGLQVRLHRPLAPQRYPVRGGRKLVHYWVARVVDPDADDVSGYVRPGEIDQVAWVPFDVAAKMLTYRHDRATLREAVRARKATRTIIILRHAEALQRRAWRGDDRRRPLALAGRRQAEALPPLLAAYGVRRVVTSTSTRCVQTVAPYADRPGVVLETTGVLSEEEATPADVRALVRSVRRTARLDESGPTVLCSHRPVLPLIGEALGVDARLEKGELVVLHVRKGTIRAMERHRV